MQYLVEACKKLYTVLDILVVIVIDVIFIFVIVIIVVIVVIVVIGAILFLSTLISAHRLTSEVCHARQKFW